MSGSVTKTGVQVESDPVEDICRNQRALLVHQPDFDMPRSLREALDFGWFISAEESMSAAIRESLVVCVGEEGVGMRRNVVVVASVGAHAHDHA